MITFVVDRRINGRAYPNLARHPAEPYTKQWREFRSHYPYTVPADLIEYCREFDYPHTIYTIDEYINAINNIEHSSRPEANDSYYIVHFGFFDHTIDYINLLPETVKQLARATKLRILFYYHEGDNPTHINNRLRALCAINNIENNSWVFVTGNTSVEKLTNFIHFPDHELLFFMRSKNHEKILKNSGSLQRRFTSLVRTHKWWRATALTDLKTRGLLDNSTWSYNTRITVDDCIADCPIEIDTLGIRRELMDFIQRGPYRADELTADQHNDHSLFVPEHYTDSACNIVFETVFDADQSGGTFLTEKTFKPILYGQPFILVAPAGSLELLRNLGYRVFDHIIDNRYDTIINNTDRWISIRRTIEQVAHLDINQFRARCAEDVEHNQQLFLASKWGRLNKLFTEIANI